MTWFRRMTRLVGAITLVSATAGCASGEQVTIDAAAAVSLARDMLQRAGALTVEDAENFPDAFVASLPENESARYWDLRRVESDRFEVVFRYESRDLVHACVSFREASGWAAAPRRCVMPVDDDRDEGLPSDGQGAVDAGAMDGDVDSGSMGSVSSEETMDAGSCGRVGVDYIASPARSYRSMVDTPELEVLLGSYVVWNGDRFPLERIGVDREREMVVLIHGPAPGFTESGVTVGVRWQVGSVNESLQPWVAAIAADAATVELIDPSGWLSGSVDVADCDGLVVVEPVIEMSADQVAVLMGSPSMP